MRGLMLMATMATALVACSEQESLLLLKVRATTPLPYVESVEVKVAGVTVTIRGLLGVPGPEQDPMQIGVYVPGSLDGMKQPLTSVVRALEQGQCAVAQAALGPIDLKEGKTMGPVLVELSPQPVTCQSEVGQACA